MFAIGIAVVLVAIGGLLGYYFSQRRLTRERSELEKTTRDQLNKLRTTIEALQQQVTGFSKTPAKVAAPPAASTPASEEIPADVIAMMAAAITAFLGKKVRIRSAKRLQSPYEIVNPWAQQGRVMVQASHNLSSSLRVEAARKGHN